VVPGGRDHGFQTIVIKLGVDFSNVLSMGAASNTTDRLM
jgi:hypothetical protein